MMDSALTGSDSLIKATVARSVKYAGIRISDDLMYSMLVQSLTGLQKESDPEVKRFALEGLTSIVHTNWQIVRDQLPAVEAFAH